MSILATSGVAANAAAEVPIGYAIHLEGAAARMVGDRKVDQFDWGGAGTIAPELTIADRVGIELPLGAVVLSDGDWDPAGTMPSGTGYGIYALPGVRLRPFGRDGEGTVSASGIWLAGGAGPVYTGSAARFGADVRVGFDLFAGELIRGGPSLAYLQIVESGGPLPEDGRVLMAGLHGAFEPLPEHAPTPSSDRDGDGLRDRDDACPDEAEDLDGHRDDDGCPDPDDDDDGVLDVVDECPHEAEDVDGHADEDGCPDPDDDDDGILDTDDACPGAAEDHDGFADEDGCPDRDNDDDGIFDADDRCPDEPETFNQRDDDDGCPDAELARVVGDEILLDERIYFHVNGDQVRVRSWPVLDSVASLLAEHPEYSLVRIQGHADDTGDERYNLALSERRSLSVRALLIHRGIAADRLVTEGFGEERPQLEADGARRVFARTKNRRVEFSILKRAPRP